MNTGNILIDGLPLSVLIDGKEYKIDADYRACMAIEHYMLGNFSDVERIFFSLSQFYCGVIPENTQEAIHQMFWFYSRGRIDDVDTEEEKTRRTLKRQTKRSYRFDVDSEMIYAAFLAQYGIDLTTCGYMHWWKFMALFDSLADDHKISRVMYYRTVDISKLPKAQKKHVEEMRKIYALPDPEKTIDAAAKLAKRDAAIRDYVRKRQKSAVNQNKKDGEDNGE